MRPGLVVLLPLVPARPGRRDPGHPFVAEDMPATGSPRPLFLADDDGQRLTSTTS